ncbi:MAG: hypothetical protein CVV27_04265 [Candidatus Melainabacteria bacterium HGW-Melainabacteria-1]|nr:MAG: hypothetical protein CVV27_04265 [Candidatus Melainabacteria bacterium HGW-Melainabacteria-1]
MLAEPVLAHTGKQLRKGLLVGLVGLVGGLGVPTQIALAQTESIPPSDVSSDMPSAAPSSTPSEPAADLPDEDVIEMPEEALPAGNSDGESGTLPEADFAETLNPMSAPFGQQNFVPDIALILDTSLGGRSLENADFGRLRQPLSLRGTDLHHVINAANGFNLNYAELTMAAAVDPYFDLFSAFHLTSFEFEIEEAYFNTRGLPFNLQVKAGKFLSHFGRINPQHAHIWSFSDQPLVHSAFFGNHGLNELGARLSWLAPTDFYLDLGLELLQGVNGSSFGTAGFSAGTQRLPEVNLPNLWVATAKTSFDLLDQLVLLAGLSYAQGGTRLAGSTAATGDLHLHQLGASEVLDLENFAGGTQVAGLDLSLRWFLDSYRELSWQSEFLWRHVGGSQYTEAGRTAWDAWQSGFYSQLLWRFAQQWRSGVRLDLITQNRRGDLTETAVGQPRYSALLEYTPSEFSRFRLQYNLDQTRALDGKQIALHEVFFQINLAMGAHGAHVF